MKLTLVQKVFLSVTIVFLVTASVLIASVSFQIKRSYLNEQQRNVASLVRKQAAQHLTAEDFKTNDFSSVYPTFVNYQEEILTEDIVRVKIYNTKGVVLYSDEPNLIGQPLLMEEPDIVRGMIAGHVMAEITKPDKEENIYERQYDQLMEIYTPIVFEDGNVVGAVETYYVLDSLNNEILNSQLYFLLSIVLIFIVLYIALFIIVNKASYKLIEQDRQLQLDIIKEKEYSSLKDEFIRLISHQLRTPAGVIKWDIESLEEELSGSLTEDQSETIGAITTNINTLISIVNNSLIVAELKPDYFTFEEQNYSVLPIFLSVLEKSKEKVDEKKLKVTFDQHTFEMLRDVNIRKDSLEKIITSLIDNAIDYSPEGSEIAVNIKQVEDSIIFEFRDRGIGIPEKEKAKIFSEAFRASNSILQKNAGSGLSLYITKSIVNGYGGQISFTSDETGTIFTVKIPTV